MPLSPPPQKKKRKEKKKEKTPVPQKSNSRSFSAHPSKQALQRHSQPTVLGGYLLPIAFHTSIYSTLNTN